MRAFIVDDERPAREELRWLLQQCDGVETVGEASSADEAREAIAELDPTPDLLFLDIDMPGIDGIRFAEWLDDLEPEPAIVFVTAYEEYAVDAFEVDALDYLMKPVRLQRLRQSVERARNRETTDESREPAPLRRISVRDGDSYRVVRAGQILLFESDDGEVYVETSGGRFPTDFSLKSLEARLDSEEFFRSHRSYLVRLDAIANIEPTGGGTYELELTAASTGDTEPRTVPLARSRVDDLERRIPGSTDALEKR